jgi:hypothetical protein
VKFGADLDFSFDKELFMMRLGRAALLVAVASFWFFSPACGSDNPPVADLGKSGESCQSHTDCGAGLRCFNNVCTPEDQGMSDSGSDGAPVVRSQKGESCAARTDCVLGLFCINNVCVESMGGADGGQTGVGERGESCRSRADCAAGLACINLVCSKADFGITPSSRECAVIACQMAEDCCPKVFSPSCPAWETYCADGGPTSPYCPLFKSQCTCVEDMYLCTPDNRCTTRGTCSDAGSLCAGGFVCNGTECVRCVKDADCGIAGQVCTPDHECATSCKETKDCSYIQTCQGGICVDASGTCTTDRECVAQTANPLSICRSKRCKTPCETDLQCSPGGTYQYRACVNGSCEDIGCTTDEECRFRLRQPITPNSNTVVVCREKKDGGM